MAQNETSFNPYQSPQAADCKEEASCDSPGRRLLRVLLLAIVGYWAFAGGTWFFAKIDSDIRIEDVKWSEGLLVSFALASSELFLLDAWLLSKRTLRRLMISGSVTLVSAIAAHEVAGHMGFAVSRYQEARTLPRLLVGMPIFLILVCAARYTLSICSVTQRESRDRARPQALP